MGQMWGVGTSKETRMTFKFFGLSKWKNGFVIFEDQDRSRFEGREQIRNSDLDMLGLRC